MFDWIVMDIIKMAVEIFDVYYCMLPKSALPDGSLVLVETRCVTNAAWANLFQILPGEQSFDLFPTEGIIAVHFRQCPNAVDMVWKQANRIGLKGIFGLNCSPGGVKDVSGGFVQKERQAVEGDHGKEIGSTLEIRAAVLGHEDIVDKV